MSQLANGELKFGQEWYDTIVEELSGDDSSQKTAVEKDQEEEKCPFMSQPVTIPIFLSQLTQPTVQATATAMIE